jgi:hypothetical protein
MHPPLPPGKEGISHKKHGVQSVELTVMAQDFDSAFGLTARSSLGLSLLVDRLEPILL